MHLGEQGTGDGGAGEKVQKSRQRDAETGLEDKGIEVMGLG